MAKRPKQITGNIALYYTCYKLSERGWNVLPTSRNAKGVDIIAYSEDGERMISIQVKGFSRRDVPSFGKQKPKIMGDFWVIVTRLASGEPETFILRRDEVEDSILKMKDGSHWLDRKVYKCEDYKERWEIIK